MNKGQAMHKDVRAPDGFDGAPKEVVTTRIFRYTSFAVIQYTSEAIKEVYRKRLVEHAEAEMAAFADFALQAVVPPHLAILDIESSQFGEPQSMRHFRVKQPAIFARVAHGSQPFRDKVSYRSMEKLHHLQFAEKLRVLHWCCFE